MYELLILLIGIELGVLYTVVFLWKYLSRRCWGKIARVGETKRCKLHEGHEGKHYWTDLFRTKYEYW